MYVPSSGTIYSLLLTHALLLLTHSYSLTYLLTHSYSLTLTRSYSLTHSYSLLLFLGNLIKMIVFLISLALVFIWTIGSLCSYMFVVVTRLRAFDNLRRVLRMRSNRGNDPQRHCTYSLTYLLTYLLTHLLTLLTHLTYLLTYSLTHSLTLTHSLLLTHSLTYSLTHFFML